MVAVPLGISAYERDYAGEPVVRVENRFMEATPTNLKEKLALLGRPGTNSIFKPGAGPIRRTFSKLGLFNGDLFVVSGGTLYRYSQAGVLTTISGVVEGTGSPAITWMKGDGYQYLLIADGLLLQAYNGGTQATGVLTRSGTPTSADVVNIGGVYYSWNAAVNTGTPNGSSANPWLINPTSYGADTLLGLESILAFDGTPGVDFSSALGGPSALVRGVVAGGPPAGTLTVSSIATDSSGNSIATTIFAGTHLSWGAATLSGGGIHALQGVYMPNGDAALALANTSGFVLIGVSKSQKFYWLTPGSLVVNALNFAEKESNPDTIVDMTTVGDQVLIAGDGSLETWYATGSAVAPFQPVTGRVYQRGTVQGTMCVVKDSVILVGDDGIVYQIGYIYGAGQPYGVNRVSHHGIEERIRVQLRSEQGLPP